MAEQVSPLAKYEQERDQAFELLKSSLDSRKNQMFDPTLLAMAQGFLAPTKTGGFGESLSTAAGNVGQVMRQQEEDLQKNAKARFEVAMAQADMNRRAAAMQEFGQRTGLSGAAPAAAPTAGAAPGAPAGAPAMPSTPGAPQQGLRDITRQDALQFAAQFGADDPYAKLMMEAAKAGSERYKIAMNGTVFDTQAGKYLDLPIPGQAPNKYFVPELGGEVSMTPNEYAQYRQSKEAGKAREWLRIHMASEGAPTGELKTAAQIEAEAAGSKELATKMAGSDASRTNDVLNAAKSARAMQGSFTRAQELINRPGIEQVMGLVNKGDVVSGITNLVNDAFRVGTYSVGVPAIKKILTDSGVPQNLLDTALELGQLEAMWQMETRKGLGAGTSISNMEQMMANRLTPSQDDPIGAYKQKLLFLQEKAKFEIELAREIKAAKSTYDKFEETTRFDEIFKNYENRLLAITKGQQPSSWSVKR
jgi:hypothetical protein